MKTLLVTGGCGFIGSTFVRQAIQKGYSVLVLDALTYAGQRENFDEIFKDEAFKTSELSSRLELVVGKLQNSKLIYELLTSKEVHAVVNFAAESHVDRSITGPTAFIDTNIVGTFELLNASLAYYKKLSDQKLLEKKSLFRLLHVSTDEVFGSLGQEGTFSEKTPYAPNSPYSASKAASDHLVRAWHHTYGLPTLITNCSNNYGQRQHPEKFIPKMIECALAGKNLPIYGNGKNIRDWIHVEDHCDGVLLALEKGKPGSSYCFSGHSERENLQVVKSICSLLDGIKPKTASGSYASQISFVEDRLGHDLRYAIDDSFAQKELGFKPKYTFDLGLKQTILWYLNHPDWCKKARG